MTAPTPAIPALLDGVTAHQADLNGWSSNLTNLYTYTQAGFRTLKPQTVLRRTTAQSIPNGTDTLISWSVADISTDGMWASGTTMTVKTAGVYRLRAQVATLAAYSTNSLYIVVNGTSSSSNAVGVFSGTGNSCSCSATLSLAVGATIAAIYNQSTGSSQSTATTFGNPRLEALWVSP